MSPPQRHDWLVAGAAMLGFAIALLLVHPGQYPFDAATQLWQARTGQFWNTTPVAMPLIWSLLLSLGGDAASLLVLNLALFWCGLGLCAAVLRGPAGWRALAMLAIGLQPLTLLQLGHLLSDAHLAAVLTCACGLVAHAATRGRRWSAWCAAILIVYAGCIRHNAILATLPLMPALAVVLAPRRARAAFVTALLALTFATSFALDRAFVSQRHTVWPSIALWDLAALSVASGELLLPPFSHGPGLDVAELVDTGAFDPTSNTFLFARSRSGMKSGLQKGSEYAPGQLAAIRAAWSRAVLRHPLAYARHRLRTFALMAGIEVDGRRGIPYFIEYHAWADNPPVAAPLAAAMHARLLDVGAQLRGGGFWSSAWPALALAGLALIVSWRRRTRFMAHLAGLFAGSLLLHAAGFALIAPGAETRYLTWPIVFAPMALLLALGAGTTADATSGNRAAAT
ncbi:MAG TPA: hypothetical protein PKO41_08490 [Dokdonella sp.]|uniref:hypothetical protein n=1 Tax=Dokdonella sp. TaxID=2291710 RepID=UPI0025BA6B8F|nr:hypothetical protein [Dokdonella sp.]MBX3691842.1 hypothetical protein [Dokdonella sp.]HNR92449.1 hypothetical protein [Dokdonella sp.]